MFTFFRSPNKKISPANFPRTAATYSFVIIMLLGVTFGAGFVVGHKTQEFVTPNFNGLRLIPPSDEIIGQQTKSPAPTPDLSLVQDVWDRIHSNYVGRKKIDDSALVYGAIKGMVSALNDPYTLFFDPTETQNFLSDVNGKFDGIGAEVGMRNGKITVIAPLKDSPAERAGLQAGDVILAVNSQDANTMSLDEAVAKIRGTTGTTVTLKLQRQNVAAPLTISVVRETISVPSMQWQIRDDGIAVISFYEFSENAPQNFRNAAQDILTHHAKGIVLDMRNNPGGYLDAAVNVAGWLLPQNSLVVSEDFGDGQKNVHRTTGEGQLKDIPIVVLLNKGSASAAEILAGSLEDDRHVQIVGEQSFGKGSVQELDSLAGDTSLKITVAHWLTPSGRSIQDHGITPTIPVAQPQNATNDVQLQKAVEVLQRQIK